MKMLVGLWLAAFGLWPFADPGHSDIKTLPVLTDIVVHFIGAGICVQVLSELLR